ncbi:histidine kinase/DNA gyrase B/HSP90-like ATPase [Cupriavidus alkaliphilus]|nr:histidine kinase/DNA gyrase B/HSP90-like ATPase [Cupriavidus alkaliphilus]
MATTNSVEEVREATAAKVRVFLTELAEGTSNYRSLHSLTQQVEHQYHGRFLIELIQNAHDAISSDDAEAQRRIALIFDPSDSEHGSLLVANDGQPFSKSNFERLSQLGDSDKDPQKNIGNKGVGFRSVLEVSDCPEIFSRASTRSQSFDGYCFGFYPSVVESLVEPALTLASSNSNPTWHVTGQPLTKEWSPSMHEKFRRRVIESPKDWLPSQIGLLSPYLLPVPLDGLPSARVQALEAHGFSTVIRLKLKSSDLASAIRTRMAELDAKTVLFLEKFTSLVVDDGIRARAFNRRIEAYGAKYSGQRVIIQANEEEPHSYACWRAPMKVSQASSAFKAAVAKLPGKWPEIENISVSIAVRLGEEPDDGRFSIFLPTRVATGSAVHVNAPFFGDLSRTSIDFEDAYNAYLFRAATELSVQVIRHCLAGGDEEAGRAAVDLIASVRTDERGNQWQEGIANAAEQVEINLDAGNFVLAEDGWRPWNETSLIPKPPSLELITEENIRQNAAFPIFHRALTTRTTQIHNWAISRRFATGAMPTAEMMAQTFESIATALLRESGDWNAFWRDVARYLPTGQEELRKCDLLLGEDGQLHSTANGTRVFFRPRQGTEDSSDIGDDSATTDVPPTLRSAVAFLSDKIDLYLPPRHIRNSVRSFLGVDSYVSQFRVETIFADILIPATPSLPAKLNGALSDKCKEILGWSLRLLVSGVSRGRKSPALYQHIQDIPVPCRGGWFPLKEASFGQGWACSAGDALETYLQSISTYEATEARDRLLLPPTDSLWPELPARELCFELLRGGGVFEGLRLHQVEPDNWNSRFYSEGFRYQLPASPPRWVSERLWMEWRKVVSEAVNAPYMGYFRYRIEAFCVFPGLELYETLNEQSRLALSELILGSLPSWMPRIEHTTIHKMAGIAAISRVPTVLGHFLRSHPWLGVKEHGSTTWSTPAERWYVSADTLAGRTRHFNHLRALPSTLARRIGQHEAWLSSLSKLGMPIFDPHSKTSSPRLLQALTANMDSPSAPDASIHFGQIRDAWKRFEPGENQSGINPLPVRLPNRGLLALRPSPDSPVLIPDSSAHEAEIEAFELPVVPMDVSDAKRLRDWFKEAYGPSIQFTSGLSLQPSVSDIPWTGAGSVRLRESELGWLRLPLLVLCAEGRGVHSDAFRERLETLQNMQISWVPDLAVTLRSDDNVKTRSVDALWIPTSRTLIATEICKAKPVKLSTALTQALERDDLAAQLQLLLLLVGSLDDEPDDLEEFLLGLPGYRRELVREVAEHVRGDLSHVTHLLAVLVAVETGAENTDALEQATSEDEVTDELQRAGISEAIASDLVRVARDSQDLFEFGRRASQHLHNATTLKAWNDALSRRGQSPLSNKLWVSQLEQQLDGIAFVARRLMAEAIVAGSSAAFPALNQQFTSILSTANFSLTHWEVRAQDAIELLHALATSWGVPRVYAEAVKEALSPEDLSERLLKAGLSFEPDPGECSRINNTLVEQVARSIQRYAAAHALRTGAPLISNPSDDLDPYLAAAARRLDREGFCSVWSEEEAFALVKRAEVPHQNDFQDALDVSTCLAEVCEYLSLDVAELGKVEEKLQHLRADALRRQRIVSVCGSEFDSSEDNLHSLWDFLAQRLPEDSLPAINLSVVTDLAPVSARKRGAGSATGKSTRTARLSKSMEALIGLAGEIHAFRLLRRQYGSEVVTDSSWKSENSLRTFPSNQVDDSLGYDISFTHKNVLYRVEVKATQGEDETFKLGSSEIRLASKLVRRGRRKKEVYLLVHVKNALSSNPTAVVLPNPYDPSFSGLFDTVEADARIRYRSK